MSARTYNPTERIGINATEAVVTDGFRWIWREQSIADFGIDAHIEAVSSSGEPTGQLIAVQVKSGASYFKGQSPDIAFYVDDAHMKYWERHVLPVVLVLHNPESRETLWQWADMKLAQRTEKGWRIDVPRSKKFDAAAKAFLADQDWEDDGIGLRRRFAIDREFMREFRDRDAYVTLDVWVNKTLCYRGLEVRFDDPDKRDADYDIPIMATRHYSIDDVLNHFLPWLDRDYHEEPDGMGDEVEGHVFSVSLSKAAKHFLDLEDFFESPDLPRLEPDPGAAYLEDEGDYEP